MNIEIKNITTRSATNNDLPQLTHFLEELVEAERPFDPTLVDGKIVYYDIQELILDKDTHVLVAEYDNKVIGCGYGQIRTGKVYEKHEFFGYLGFIFVKPEFRGNGISRLLIKDLKSWVLSKGITEVRLEVYHEHEAAIKSYEKDGFKKLLTTMRCDIG